MQKNSKIYVAGHQGLVGSALMRNLHKNGYQNIVTRTFSELDLRRQQLVEDFFEKEKPKNVFLAAAKVGGIHANNTYKAEFIYDNICIATNVIHAAYKFGVEKLLNLGSSCIYPKLAPQPLTEEALLTGPLEPTNEPYAVAKIAAIKMCQYYNEQYKTNFFSVMPTNLYGPGDNFDLNTSHVLPALIRKFHDAKIRGKKTVTIWGTGNPYREFLHVDDLASAVIFLMQNHIDKKETPFVNIGTGKDISIKELGLLIKQIVGFEGKIVFDTTKPDGTPKKLLDVSKIESLGWKHVISLEEGIKKTYAWYLEKLSTKSVSLPAKGETNARSNPSK